jgi:tetratricopeptide (TPR) repeat protein
MTHFTYHKQLTIFSLRTLIFCILTCINMGSHATEKQTLLQSRDLLFAHHFNQLDTRLKQANDHYLSGLLSTRDYYAAFQTLWLDSDVNVENGASERLKGHIEKWIEATQSAYALSVLANFYVDVGYEKRGTKWAKDTPKESFVAMRDYFSKAQEAFKRSQGMDKNILNNYIEMARMLKSFSSKSLRTIKPEKNRLNRQIFFEILPSTLQKVLTYFFPARFVYTERHDTHTRFDVFQHPFFQKAPKEIWKREAIWNHIIHNATPRWGGSYSEMNIIINHEIPTHYDAYDSNDKHYFEGWIVADKLKVLYKKEEFNKGEELLSTHLSEAKTSTKFYKQAIDYAKKAKRFDDCYKYAELLANERPWRKRAWKDLGFCAFKLQRWESMNTAYKHVIYLGGTHKYYVHQLGVSYMYLHEYEKAYPLFLQAVEIDPEYTKYTDQYTQYIEQQKPESMSLQHLTSTELISQLYYIPTTLANSEQYIQ